MICGKLDRKTRNAGATCGPGRAAGASAQAQRARRDTKGGTARPPHPKNRATRAPPCCGLVRAAGWARRGRQGAGLCAWGHLRVGGGLCASAFAGWWENASPQHSTPLGARRPRAGACALRLFCAYCAGNRVFARWVGSSGCRWGGEARPAPEAVAATARVWVGIVLVAVGWL